MLIKLKQRSISSICRRIRVKPDDILLGNARYLFNRNIFPGNLGPNRGCKDVGIPRISEQDVIGFYPYPAANGTYGALFQLGEHGRIALDALSIERRGGLLFVFINSRPITELQIDKRVSDGKIYISSGLSSADIELMKKDWRLLGQRKR